MLTLDVINQIISSFGGISFVVITLTVLLGGIPSVVIALTFFLANIWTKRIVNNELAAHKLELQKQINDAKVELQREAMRHKSFTSISKEKYQELFEERIKLYQNLLLVKKQIDDEKLECADKLALYANSPRPFAEVIQKINSAAREHPMLMSNELATLSNQLYKESSAIFAKAKVDTFYANENFTDSSQVNRCYRLSEVKDSVLSGLHAACGNTYNQWLERLELDVSKIRESLDFTNTIWRAKC